MPSMAIRWNEWIDCKPKWREYRASSTNSLETEHQLHARAIRGMPARTNCPFPSEHLIASLPAREASNPSEGLWSDIEQKKRSEEHTSELQSLMRISYAVFCLKKKKKNTLTERDDKESNKY